jgi:uncharacterized protein YndB with AHSA1/START domain
VAKQLREEGLDFLDRAPIQVRAETTIAASPASVWAAIADTPTWTEWFAGMKDARLTSPAPVGVGSTRTVVVPPLTVTEAIIAFEPEARFAFHFVTVNLPLFAAMVEDVTLEAGAGGTTTRVAYRQSAELVPWARALAPVLRRQLQGKVEASLAGLDAWALTHATADPA